MIGALATRLPNGAAQTQPVWFELEGNDVLANTTKSGRRAVISRPTSASNAPYD